jgi:tetratricopeptide (TPR) repeat protein
MKITTCILCKRPDSLRETLAALPPIGDVLVGYWGDAGAVLRACREAGAAAFRTEFPDDHSRAKNHLLSAVKTPWTFVLEPGEKFLAGADEIVSATARPGVYAVQLLQGQVLSKEARLWPTGRVTYRNPVFETPAADGVVLDTVLASPAAGGWEGKLALVKRWQDLRSTSAEAHYYHACVLLGAGRYDDFIREAENYLFRTKTGMSAVMTKYYLGLTQLYHRGDTGAAVRCALPCIAVKPTMAEFWCLLGDAYYKLREYDSAAVFYENAMILGSRRLRSDLWPMEIPKYGEYPGKMIESCRRIKAETELIITNR